MPRPTYVNLNVILTLLVFTAYMFGSSQQTHAAPIAAVTVSSNVSGGSGVGAPNTWKSNGWDFTANTPITVTALGFLDVSNSFSGSAGDGLQTDHYLGLWDSAGNELGTAFLPKDGGFSQDFFRYVDLPSPVALQQSETYRIGATFPRSSSNDANANLTSGIRSEITRGGNYTSAGTGLHQLYRPTVPYSSSFGAPVGASFLFEPADLGVPIGGSGGASVKYDAIQELEPGTSATELGGLHRLDAESFGGAGRVERSNILRRSFTFDATGSDPVDVFFFAGLDGFMEADLGGEARVEATLRLFEYAGNVIGSQLGADAIDIIAESTASNKVEVTVFEKLGFDVTLIPGNEYLVESSLKVLADQRSIKGAARSLFADTFEYTISGVNDNPFDFDGQTTERMMSEATVSEPTLVSLMLLGLFGARLATRRRMC